MQTLCHTSRAGGVCRWAIGFIAATVLVGCGYKGPLYMPPPAPDESLTTPPSSVSQPEASPAAQPQDPAAPRPVNAY